MPRQCGLLPEGSTLLGSLLTGFGSLFGGLAARFASGRPGLSTGLNDSLLSAEQEAAWSRDCTGSRPVMGTSGRH